MNVQINAKPLDGYVKLTADVEAQRSVVASAVGVFATDLINKTPQTSLTRE